MSLSFNNLHFMSPFPGWRAVFQECGEEGESCCASLVPTQPCMWVPGCKRCPPTASNNLPLQTLGCSDPRQSWLKTSHWSWFPTISPHPVSPGPELRAQWALREAAVEATGVSTGRLKAWNCSGVQIRVTGFFSMSRMPFVTVQELVP